ncbi:pantetheine-phosphate adenylyltransferase [Parvularcula sp. ZS-1/3]|uniref:Phosphopantetheine adenylyltransferase n=1 Tax=Parvularcula mediterranea TaxID=2732508 RepID=A0A7Y3W4D4_9PROT|nr:pantetheine-phosphate adenylyltransferase [Parvularcula mediterranea]NNU15157.1 pantetheine-phosphate adenylyltransferase [Parvularcula mediterranea]
MTKPLIGLYPGTFDPITLGHVDIIKRAVKLCDELVIGVARHSGKDPLFSLEERQDLVRASIADMDEGARATVRVEPFEGLLIHYAESLNCNLIIRGLRAVSDFEYEFQMVGMNSTMNDDIETVFLMADAKYQSIASRLVKQIAQLKGDFEHFVPEAVVAPMKEKLKA